MGMDNNESPSRPAGIPSLAMDGKPFPAVPDVCPLCGLRTPDPDRSICAICLRLLYERNPLLEEHDRAVKRVRELEQALRYAAGCATLEMVRDTARGMGVIE